MQNLDELANLPDLSVDIVVTRSTTGLKFQLEDKELFASNLETAAALAFKELLVRYLEKVTKD